MPGKFVVLAIGVVVASLGSRNFVPTVDHWYALAEQECREQIAHLSLAKNIDFFVVGGSFRAHVPGTVIVGSIGVALSVGFVVLLTVADQIAQSETIVRRDEIDACVRLAAVVLVEIAGPGQSIGNVGELALVSFPEAADRVPILTVPLSP